MNLAIFDLDNTLLNGDSDYCWGCFLADKGIVDPILYRQGNLEFYEQYKAGTLNIYKFLEFSLKPLSENKLADLLLWREEFIKTRIRPIILPKARELIEWHRDRGDELLIITATNRFVTERIAENLGIDNLLATDPEISAGRFTGKVSGIPCFQHGKVERYREWILHNNKQPEQTWFYSDSHNDIPLLELVTHPIAVDADEILSSHAIRNGWDRISLRNQPQVLI